MAGVLQRSSDSVLLQKWRKGSEGGGFWRSARMTAAGEGHSRGRGPTGDTDPDASGPGGAALLRAVREQHRGREKEMRLTCEPREFKLNFGNLNSIQTCFDPKRTLPSSKNLK
jgi:hypothetical protein